MFFHFQILKKATREANYAFSVIPFIRIVNTGVPFTQEGILYMKTAKPLFDFFNRKKKKSNLV